MKSKHMLLLLCLLASCNVSKKITSVAEEKMVSSVTLESHMKSVLDSLFRSHLKVTINYTEEQFLPELTFRTDSSGTVGTVPHSKPVTRKELTIGIESDTETHIHKSDSLADHSATLDRQGKKTINTKDKKSTVSWKLFIWITLTLIGIAIGIYCVKNKINPFTQLLKLLRTWLFT
ncbi:MAG: hypothetical protein EGP82_02070 [Odoribacter splanchnicus]|nr:hypothetical protein [Odoribacter splanchnicus]